MKAKLDANISPCVWALRGCRTVRESVVVATISNAHLLHRKQFGRKCRLILADQ